MFVFYLPFFLCVYCAPFSFEIAAMAKMVQDWEHGAWVDNLCGLGSVENLRVIMAELERWKTKHICWV